MTDDAPWQSSISEVSANQIFIRGYDIAELMEKISFSDAIYLVFRGNLPDAKSSELFRAILVSCIDHGVTPPSVLATRTVMSAGNSLNTAVAAGILAIGDVHGGAIEQSARILQEVARKESDVHSLAISLVADLKANDQRMPGFGHQLHTSDPRTIKLLELAKRLGLHGRHAMLAEEIEKTFAGDGKKPLPLNIDGAIAAVISDLGFDWQMGKAFFMLSRIGGLVAHAYEEKTTQRPLRKLGDFNTIYTGHPHRTIRD
jgi:citrate synthase